MATESYKLLIRKGCTGCLACANILPGWPSLYHETPLALGRWAAEEHAAQIDRIVASCPLDLVDLVQVS